MDTKKHHSPRLTDLKAIELQLRTLINKEEHKYVARSFDQVDSLWSHCIRVAKIAEKIGMAEGVDRTACGLAGLFHDAGKFANGEYHRSGIMEEEHSVQIFREIAQDKSLDNLLADSVAEAILQVYQSVANPSHLARILYDADNLDKLGLPGIGNFFTKKQACVVEESIRHYCIKSVLN